MSFTIQYRGTPRAWWGEFMFGTTQSHMLRYLIGGRLLAHLLNNSAGAAIGVFDGTRPFGVVPARPDGFFWKPLTNKPPKFARTDRQTIDIAGTATPQLNRDYLILVADPNILAGPSKGSQYMKNVIDAMVEP